MEMALCNRRKHLHSPHSDSFLSEISENCGDIGSGRFQTHVSDDEESLRTRVLCRNFSVCDRRKRDLCLDAHAGRGLPRLARLDGHLRHLHVLCTSRRGKVPWLADALTIELGCSRYRIQPGNTAM